MKILVTGGLGFIGSHTCVELLENGHEVVVVDNLNNSKKDILDKIKKITGSDKIKLYIEDVKNEKALDNIYIGYNDNDVNGTNYSKNDIKDVIDEIAKKYESKTGDYNYFIDFIKTYLKGRYPFDFYRGSTDNNIAKDLNNMKKSR